MDDEPRTGASPLPDRVLRFEVITVLLVVVLPWTAAGLYRLVRYLATGERARLITVDIVSHLTLDVVVQVALLVAASMGVVLVAYVLSRSGESLRSIGLTLPSARDVGLSVAFTVLFLVLAPVVGAIIVNGLGFHGISRTATPYLGLTYLPVGLVSSLRAGLLEEVVVCGYLITRLRQVGWSDRKALYTSTAVRASYHVYGGVFLVCFTVLFGLVLGRFYEKTQRLSVVVMTHVFYDAVLFTIALAR